MTIRVQTILMLAVVMAAIALTGCGHYTCGVTFGNSSCTPTGPGLGGGGGGNAATAFAYVVNSNGSINGYTLQGPQKIFEISPNFTPPATAGSFNDIGMVQAQNKFLYAVYSDLQKIYGWSIDSAGNLTPITGMPLTIPLAAVPLFGYNEKVVITNPTGTLLFISDTANGQIWVYQIGSSGSLTATPGSPFLTPGILPQNLGMDGQGRFLYVSMNDGLLDHASLGVAAYSVTGTGVLAPIATYNNPMWEMVGDPSGSFMIWITQVGTTATIYAPFFIAVQPKSTTGPFIYSFSVNDANTGPNPTEGYQFISSTPTISVLPNSPFTVGVGDAAWGDFDPSGNYLFHYSEQSLTAYVVGAGTPSQIGPVALVTGGYWAVADGQ
jgi:hypothetical protein